MSLKNDYKNIIVSHISPHGVNLADLLKIMKEMKVEMSKNYELIKKLDGCLKATQLALKLYDDLNNKERLFGQLSELSDLRGISQKNGLYFRNDKRLVELGIIRA